MNPDNTTELSQLDVVFDGTWVIAAKADGTGTLIGVDVYSPACGHPHGALFTHELAPDPWPDSESFYMLDDHGHNLVIERDEVHRTGMHISEFDQSINHCLPGGRPIGGNWDLMITISFGPNRWVSGDTVLPQITDAAGKTVPCFSGKDVPAGRVSSFQKLSFLGTIGVEFCGAPVSVQRSLPSPWLGNGTLIFAGEVPYIPTIRHERAAISAMATLAGLDLALDYPLPKREMPAGRQGERKFHTGPVCGHALIVLPQERQRAAVAIERPER